MLSASPSRLRPRAQARLSRLFRPGAGLAFHRNLPRLQRHPSNRGRTKHRPGHNLLIRLHEFKDDVLRFLVDFSVPFRQSSRRSWATGGRTSGCRTGWAARSAGLGADLAADDGDSGCIELRRLAAARRARRALPRKCEPARGAPRLGRDRARALRGNRRGAAAGRPGVGRGLARRSEPRAAPRRLSRRLLGFVGGPEDGARLDRRIERALASDDATGLAAMIAADLQLGDPSRLDWIVARVFADRKSTMPEIEAALLALNVLGDANEAAARARASRAASATSSSCGPDGRLRRPAIGQLGLL